MRPRGKGELSPFKSRLADLKAAANGLADFSTILVAENVICDILAGTCDKACSHIGALGVEGGLAEMCEKHEVCAVLEEDHVVRTCRWLVARQEPAKF